MLRLGLCPTHISCIWLSSCLFTALAIKLKYGGYLVIIICAIVGGHFLIEYIPDIRQLILWQNCTYKLVLRGSMDCGLNTMVEITK